MSNVSITEQLIDLIALRGKARSADLAIALEMETTNVTAILAAHVKSGLLEMEKVSAVTGKLVNEYRLAAGIPPAQWRDYKPNLRGKRPLGNDTHAHPVAAVPCATGRPAGGGGQDGVCSFPPSENPGSTRSVPPSEARASSPLPCAGEGVAEGEGFRIPYPRAAGDEPEPAHTPARYLLADDGELYLELGADEVIRLSRPETLRLCEFLADVHERVARANGLPVVSD